MTKTITKGVFKMKISSISLNHGCPKCKESIDDLHVTLNNDIVCAENHIVSVKELFEENNSMIQLSVWFDDDEELSEEQIDKIVTEIGTKIKSSGIAYVRADENGENSIDIGLHHYCHNDSLGEVYFKQIISQIRNVVDHI